jgi:hypothetical protein
MLSADTMTEPLFALILVVALRLHEMKKEFAGMAVASLLILARPEGFFIGRFVGNLDSPRPLFCRTLWQRLISTLILASGAFLWWLTALLLSGDALFIRNNWPPEWGVISATGPRGIILGLHRSASEYCGAAALCFPDSRIGCCAGPPTVGYVTAVFLSFFVLHSVFRSLGLFGSAGYARYFVCVAPAIALLTLNGWNQLAAWVQKVPRVLQIAAAAVVFFLSGLAAVSYTDYAAYTRDAGAVADAVSWYHMHGRPITNMIYSQAYMAILMDQDVGIRVKSGSNRAANLEIFRSMPIGTLVFWDRETGPSWYDVKADDLVAEGYTPLYSQSYVMNGWMNPRHRFWYHDWGPRKQEMHLLYKEN